MQDPYVESRLHSRLNRDTIEDINWFYICEKSNLSEHQDILNDDIDYSLM
jgi:hypothetical protein